MLRWLRMCTRNPMITRIEKLITFFLREPNSASPTIEVSASKMILDWLAINNIIMMTLSGRKEK